MDNPFDLAGEIALVTGAAGGLGRRFCAVLAANGAHVVATGPHIATVEELAAELRRDGAQALAVELDVSDQDRIAAAFDAAEAAFGTVSILVNNAGVAGDRSALRVTPKEWRRIMAVNLDGAWWVAQEAARRMVRAGTAGAIVNLASILGLKVHQRVAPYAVSKAAVVQMTKALALEVARHGIRVNALAPGSFETGMTRDFLKSYYAQAMVKQIPLHRIGEAADLDGALLLLASRASSYMNGSVVTVDGGHSLVIP
jgi:NAD(P)-dependent dehydrogenase (short-subunit alcohol dehydrogenase family)